MNFAEAVEQVRPFIIKHEQYSVVEFEHAIRLLKLDRFTRLMNNAILNKSPKSGTIYFWNVADYLTKAE